MHIDPQAAGLDVEVRAPEPDDAIDGIAPVLTVAPATAAAVAGTLAWASRERLALVVRGAGTKLAWGRPPTRAFGILDMRRLNRILAHQHGDLTATVEAGITLRELNATLAGPAQWLPLDPPFAERASIGGLLAANDSGPSRHRFGTPRDLVIGVTLATADGKLARAGGQVVKNVAGYDLSRLVSGSFGSLAVIISATFKLAPLPPARATVVLDVSNDRVLDEVLTAITASQLEPVAFDIDVRRGPAQSDRRTRVLLRFASVSQAVDAQAADACGRVGALGVVAEVVREQAEQHLWDSHTLEFWRPGGAIVRVSWPPASLGAVVREIEEIGTSGAVGLIGRAGLGSGLIAIDGDTTRQAGVIHRLRKSTRLGNVIIVGARPDLKSQIDVWPPQGNARLLESVKRAMDPHDTLGAGRGVI